jgi:hypothetical protein
MDPDNADSTTKIWEIPVKGETNRSPKPTLLEIGPASATASSCGSKGWVRKRDVKATRLKEYVHWGISMVSLRVAETNGVAAAPTIVDEVQANMDAGPKTAAAHPIKHPL